MKTQLLTLFLIAFFSISANDSFEQITEAEQQQAETDWVNATFNAMSEDERLGQLFMIRAHSDKGADHIAKVEGLIKDYHVGGLCFFQGTPEKQVELLNKYQKLTKRIPLMVSMDAEWGLGMRLKKSTISFPRQLMLGAIQDNRLIYDMGKEIARQCRRVGVHVNFAPVADVNNNPSNPVINTRSFGEDRYNVATKSYMYAKGLQDGNVMACAKHFPGHGDTDVDSHYDLPVITHDAYRLDSIEMFPFRLLAEHGIQSMMVAHLHVPTLDATKNLPTTLSQNAVTNVLKNEMGFEGLIFTDGLGMKGVTKHYKSGEVEAKALVAGNDVLLLPQDVPAAFRIIKEYIAAGKLTTARIHESVKKVLRYKYRLGLTSFTDIPLTNLREDLNSPQAQVLKRRLIANALTLVRNRDNRVPFKDVQNTTFATLSIGSTRLTTFQKTLDKYAPMEHYNTAKDISSSKQAELTRRLKEKDFVIIGIHDMSSYASKDFGLNASIKNFIKTLAKETNVVLTVFGNPYSLKYFDEVNWLLEAYDEDEMTEDLAAQALFGAFSISGRLPVTASDASQFNNGQTTGSLFRLQYGLPESVGMNSKKLNQIDGLMQDAINIKATPGGVVMVVKDGKVIFEKGYGHHSYAKKRAVNSSDIYDMASITKIAASTISVMKLQDEGKLSIYQPMSDYLTELKSTNKNGLKIEDIMAHRAGLKTWIKFYEKTLSGKKSPRPSSKFYAKKQTEKFNIPVTQSLFMLNDHADAMWQEIKESELRPTKEYKYSDLGFYLISDMVKRLSGKSLDQYVLDEFYQPLGLSTAMFNPWKKFDRTSIPPTEEDKYFRRQKVQGYVHDMGAAMLGGVSGHAGLFTNANDLAIIMQMLLNNGYYGGKQYLNAQTIRTFTSRHPSCTRRGIGFDMREIETSKSQNMSPKASFSTFGHLGFTGTCTWADPEHNLIYIFFSNRTYPSMNNYKLNKEDYRPRIQSIIYEALEY